MRRKYGNHKTQFGGLTFDSKAEAARWAELTILEKTGRISGLRRQVAIELVPGARLHGASRARPAVRLIVDFHYREGDVEVWEDCKGFETPVSVLKRHLALALKGIDVRLSP